MTATEGITQGDPLAISMYRIGIIPLIELLQKPNVTQKWYADDGSAAGYLSSLRAILGNLDVHGKAFGYNVQPSKCQIIVKENSRDSAIKVFEGKTIIMVDGFRVLGSVKGTPSACDKIEQNVRQQLVSGITGKNHITEEDRNLLALPLRMGGLDLLSYTDFSRNYEWPQVICNPLVNSDPEIAEMEQTLVNRNIKTKRQNITLQKRLKLWKIARQKKMDNNSSVTERSIELAKRATLKKYNFSLNKLSSSSSSSLPPYPVETGSSGRS